ncbi:hypothetical protein EDD71_10372 [Fonticella tunisiensis]|uniref:Uncharacterized protein n=1 Tax=Fonticella tunisiensis TaxID=1096341 RepID=A0A4R7KVQ8_9CLOT|nr:hypothetical protein EDD71_10372 [Fonticella tunisiensis]
MKDGKIVCTRDRNDFEEGDTSLIVTLKLEKKLLVKLT